MENIKKFEEITLSDVRNTYYVLINQVSGEKRKLSLEDVYKVVESVELHKGVPDDVRSQFNVARNLSIYTWFCYSFHQVSELKAFSTLELALRTKFGKNKGVFKRLLREAVDSGLIKDRGFRHIRETLKDADSTSYVDQLPELMPRFRNDLAHGSTTLYPGSFTNLKVCCDFINQLFSQTET